MRGEIRLFSAMENQQHLATIIEACMYSIEKMYPNKLITTYIYIYLFM